MPSQSKLSQFKLSAQSKLSEFKMSTASTALMKMLPSQSQVKKFELSTADLLKVKPQSVLFKPYTAVVAYSRAAKTSKVDKGNTDRAKDDVGNDKDDDVGKDKDDDVGKGEVKGTEDEITIQLTPSPSFKEEQLCETILNALSESEIETAARSSFEYFMSVVLGSTNGDGNSNGDSDGDGNGDEDEDEDEDDDSIKKMYAMKMARRHLIAEKGDTDSAIRKMKSTIAFREEMNIDEMRQCFYNLQDESRVMVETRKGLEKELADGKHFVRGHDLEDHAFFIIFPRHYTSFDKDWYLKGKLYSLERAIAYSERISGGSVEKVNVVFDYNGYVSDKHEPPLSLIKELLFCLRDHYPERLRHMFFVDAPFRFRAFWTLVKPFIDPVTKKKIRFVSGNAQKQSTFEDFVAPEQSMAFMHKDGTKPLDFNIEKWTYMVPFDHDVDGMNM